MEWFGFYEILRALTLWSKSGIPWSFFVFPFSDASQFEDGA